MKTKSKRNYTPEQELRFFRLFAKWSKKRKYEYIKKAPKEWVLRLKYEWKAWARDSQLPPEGQWSTWCILSGRGWGKTRTGAEWVIEKAYQYPGCHIALVGRTVADVRDVMIKGRSGILAISPPWFKPEYKPSLRLLVWPNGSYATTYSADEPDQLRGPQHSFAWLDERASWQYDETWDNLILGLRISPVPGVIPQCVVTTTPRNTKAMKALVADPTTVVTRRSTLENKENLSPRFIVEINRRYAGTRLGDQEIEGHIIDDIDGALWKRQWIDDNRVTKHPELKRIVVAVDPPASSDATSGNPAEAGIVVAGLGVDGHGYMLGDYSLVGTPDEWATAALTAYALFEADAIIGEVNNGGEMVGAIIYNIAKQKGMGHVPYKAVRATRGKQLRAEPISSLYQRALIHHCGVFPDTEYQMCNWVPGEKSPDRCFVAGTLVMTDQGEKPIETICVGMKVLTRQGWKRVIAAGMTNSNTEVISVSMSNGRTLTGTGNHPVFVQNKGYVPLNSLVWGDIMETWNEKQLSTMVSPLRDTQPRIDVTRASIIGPTMKKATVLSVLTPSIERYGRRIMAPFHQAVKSITSTVTRLIIPSTTWSVLPRRNMPNATKPSFTSNVRNMLNKYVLLQRNGTLQRRVMSGMFSMEKIAGLIEIPYNRYVFSAEKRTLLDQEKVMSDSVLALAYPNGTSKHEGTTKIGSALCADQPLMQKNQNHNVPALVSVLGLYDAGKASVYNLQVEDAHEYYAQCVLVHNCDANVWAFTELMTGVQAIGGILVDTDLREQPIPQEDVPSGYAIFQ